MKSTITLKLRGTTIALKKGTKDLLDSLGSKKESYDEIIRKIIRENHDLNKTLEKLAPKESPNKLFISQLKRKSLSENINNKKIFFSYNVPKKPLKYFKFNIIYKKIITENIETKSVDNYSTPLEMAEDYLKIYEKLIKAEIDPLFKMDLRRKLDLNWWEQKIIFMGLSRDTYKSDIEEKLIHFGVLP